MHFVGKEKREKKVKSFDAECEGERNSLRVDGRGGTEFDVEVEFN